MNKKIINLGIVADVDAGKTTITEQLLYHCGATRVAGSVNNGTTSTDWLEIEKKRGISVKSSCVSFEYGDTTINIIDTPGHVDFSGEVERALSVLDAAILVLSSTDGVKGQTSNLFDALVALKIPTMICVNKVDIAGSHIDTILTDVQEHLTSSIAVVADVHNIGEKDCTIIGLEQLSPMSLEKLSYTLSDFDDTLTTMLLEEKTIPFPLILSTLIHLTNKADIYPLIYTSAANEIGIDTLIHTIVTLFNGVSADVGISSDVSAVIYKVMHDATMGKACHVRMYSGSLRTRDTVKIYGSDQLNKLSQIKRTFGNKTIDIPQITSGNIGVVYGLANGKTGDVIGNLPVHYERYNLVSPLFTVKVLPLCVEELLPLVKALTELSDEDPLLELEWLADLHELHIKITGMMQLEILEALLLERYSLYANFSPATIIYKETPTTSGYGRESYTMPKPCWAVIEFLMAPNPRNTGLTYSSFVSDDDCFYKYQDHIKQCLPSALKQGIYGWEVVDLDVKLTWAQHHTMHTHPLDFFLATPLAVMNGLQNTGSTLLEPMQKVKITAPEDILGKVIGELLEMRGEFDGPVIKKDTFTAEAILPVATSLDFPVRLNILSSGKSNITSRFSHYAPCPIELGQTTPYRGVSPLERSKYILYKRGAIELGK